MAKVQSSKSKAKRTMTRREFANAAYSGPSFQDISPRFPPTDVKPVEPIAPKDKPRLGAAKAGTTYPLQTPASPPMRTQGESSISTERVTLSTRMRFNPLRGLTPDRLGQYLDQFDIGFFRQAAITWDKIERRDPTLKSVAPKRKKAVARHGFEVLTVNNVPAGMEGAAAAQVEALTYFYNNLSATDAIRPDQQGGLSLLVRQMMDAQSKYYAVHEVVWQPTPDGLTAQFVFCPLWWFEGVTGKLRYLDNEFQVYGRDMAPAEWLITVGEGYMESCSVAWMFKHLSLQDWVAFNERTGGAFIDAATSASPGSPDWDALVSYVQNFGADGGGVRSDNAKVELVQADKTSVDMFNKMVSNMDRAMTIIWRGGDLGTSAGKDATGASLQKDESEILEGDDSILIQETLTNQVSRFVIAWTFGAGTPVLAYIKFGHAQEQNVDEDLKIDEFLLDAGAPMEVNATLERYGRPVPPKGAVLLVKQMPPPIPGGPGDPLVPQPGGKTEVSNAKEGPELPALEEAGQVHYAQALAHDMQVVAEECQAVLAIDDDRVMAQRAVALIDKIEKLKKDILHLPKAAQALAETMIAGLFTGLTASTHAKAAKAAKEKATT